MTSTSVLTGVNGASLNMIQELLKNSDDETGLYNNYGAGSVIKNSMAKNLGLYSDSSAASVTSEVAQAAIKKATSELRNRGEDFISFSKISAYQKELEEEFSLQTKADLYSLGVDLETAFDLKMDTDGKISVSCDDPVAKEKIEKYLEDDPKVCVQFGYIQALANVERARQSPATLGTSLRDAQAALNTSTLASFLNNTMNSGTFDYSALTAKFGISSEETQFFTGLNFTV